MKALNWVLVLFSILACVVSLVAINLTNNERVLVPDYYRSLDTTIPFNDLARKSLDLRISNAEYDAIRWQYFEDRVAPRFSAGQEAAAWEDFKGRTERPDSPGRQKTLKDFLSAFELAFAICAFYLFARLGIWTWRKILVPAKRIVSEHGVYGLFRLVLFGKSTLSVDRREAGGK
jgi:hypothetical protein